VKEKYPDICVVAFKAEYGTNVNELTRKAKESMEKSRSDLVIANDVGRTDIGFGSDYNEVILIPREGEPKVLKKASKDEIASQILDFIVERKLVNF